jgi:hypothetical protein
MNGHIIVHRPELVLYYRLWCYRVTKFNSHLHRCIKNSSKHEWIERANIYHHTKFEVEQKFVQEEKKSCT